LNKYPKIKYFGCDYSEIMVGESKKNNNEFIENGRADFICGQADELPFEDATFDQIFTINTLYFWEDTTAVFNELKRVLKPSGQIIIAVRPKKVMEKYPFVNTDLKCTIEKL
jgi:ubiquinone/menaquinone biosynthesis C-methylase UbiE